MTTPTPTWTSIRYSRSAAQGIRLIPPGDPYLQKPNRPLLAPDPELRKRLFRPLASPGAVLRDGRLAGLWRVKAKGRKAEVTIEKLRRLARADLQEEAQRVADLRGASEAALVLVYHAQASVTRLAPGRRCQATRRPARSGS